MDAELRLGEAVSEDRLAAALGVSRTPVREALTALQLQGLVNIVPQRGSFVFLPSEEDVAELCEFRMMIESRAISLCHARRREDTLAQLRQAEEAMERAESSADFLASAHADAAFHEALFKNCGNQFLTEAYGLVSGRIGALRSNCLQPVAGVRSGSMREHREIIDAFAAGDLLQAEAVLASHIFKMRERYSEAMRNGFEVNGRPRADASTGAERSRGSA